MYGSQRGDLADDFVITGWNSSYTNDPPPPEEMREWVDTTVAAINDLTPAACWRLGVAPICCCNGWLPVRTTTTAPTCPAARSRPCASEWTTTTSPCCTRRRTSWKGCRTAHFDTMVLNSVAQYFPDVAYLTEVLTRTAGLMARLSTMFVGD